MATRKRIRTTRNSKGQFVKGHPGCKKPGQKYFSGLGPLLRSKEPKILKKALEQALSGKHPQIMVLLLHKMYGRGPLSNFSLQGDLTQMMAQIISQVGKETPEALSAATKLLEVHVKIVELDALSERIAALENDSRN